MKTQQQILEIIGTELKSITTMKDRYYNEYTINLSDERKSDILYSMYLTYVHEEVALKTLLEKIEK